MRKYLQKTHIIKGCYPKYTNLIYNSWSSTIRKQTHNLKLVKDLKRHFTKEDPQTVKKHMRRWCILYVIRSGKCNLKQWDLPIHLLEWPKSETWTSPNDGNDTEQKELSFISHRYAKWYSKFGSVSVLFCFVFTKLNINGWIFMSALFIIVKHRSNQDVLQ